MISIMSILHKTLNGVKEELILTIVYCPYCPPPRSGVRISVSPAWCSRLRPPQCTTWRRWCSCCWHPPPATPHPHPHHHPADMSAGPMSWKQGCWRGRLALAASVGFRGDQSSLLFFFRKFATKIIFAQWKNGQIALRKSRIGFYYILNKHGLVPIAVNVSSYHWYNALCHTHRSNINTKAS
jgi:hypothetical protein